MIQQSPFWVEENETKLYHNHYIKEISALTALQHFSQSKDMETI